MAKLATSKHSSKMYIPFARFCSQSSLVMLRVRNSAKTRATALLPPAALSEDAKTEVRLQRLHKVVTPAAHKC